MTQTAHLMALMLAPFALTAAGQGQSPSAPISTAGTAPQTTPAPPVAGASAAVIPSPNEIVAAAPASDWVDMAAADLLVMDLAPDRDGKPRRVVMQLLPPPFSQGWVGNIRALAAAHWWDGTSINRVQDNYVVQWGDSTEKKELPAGLQSPPQDDYVVPKGGDLAGRRIGKVRRDAYARRVSFRQGWPQASDGKANWPVHCYGMVGVGRNLPPDTGTGAELYTVIGQAPRHLDRNIALVGRVVLGIEHLSSLPRGTGALGFYEKAEERVPVTSVRLASDLPEADRPRIQYLSTDSDSFARYADARANRRDAFFLRPAGGADICNVPVPVRKAP